MFWVQDSATLENERHLWDLIKKANINRPYSRNQRRARTINANEHERKLD